MTISEDDLHAALNDLAEEWAPNDTLRARIRDRVERAEPGRRRWPVIAAAVAAAVLVVAAVAPVIFDGDDDAAVVTDNNTPITPGWRTLSTAPIEGRSHAAAVWTGSEMLVWGGTTDGGSTELDDGAAYDPVTDTWRTIASAPRGGRYSVVAWSGAELLLWGYIPPDGSDAHPDGLAYDPATDTWRDLPPAPYPDWPHSAGAWTGTELIVWGGAYENEDGSISAADVGAAYDPGTNTWTKLPLGTGPGRSHHGAAWTGQELILWGPYGDGVAYDPAAGAWRDIAASHLRARTDPTVVSIGNKVYVWGGFDAKGSYLNDGATYDPVTDTWDTPTEITPETLDTSSTIPPVAIGDRLAILGGRPDRPLTGLTVGPAGPRPVFPAAPITARSYPATVWTGSELLVWGGEQPGGPVDDGAAWRPPPAGSTATCPSHAAPNTEDTHGQFVTRNFVLTQQITTTGQDWTAYTTGTGTAPAVGIELTEGGRATGTTVHDETSWSDLVENGRFTWAYAVRDAYTIAFGELPKVVSTVRVHVGEGHVDACAIAIDSQGLRYFAVATDTAPTKVEALDRSGTVIAVDDLAVFPSLAELRGTVSHTVDFPGLDLPVDLTGDPASASTTTVVGEALDPYFAPGVGAQVHVVGVAVGLSFELHEAPDPDSAIVATLRPDDGPLTATGENRLVDGRVWSRVRFGDITAWGDRSNLFSLGQPVTTEFTTDEAPTADRMETLAEAIGVTYERNCYDDPKAVIVAGPTEDRSLAEATVDVLVGCDDSTAGYRIQVTADHVGDQYVARTMTATPLCSRGGGGTGGCL